MVLKYTNYKYKEKENMIRPEVEELKGFTFTEEELKKVILPALCGKGLVPMHGNKIITKYDILKIISSISAISRRNEKENKDVYIDTEIMYLLGDGDVVTITGTSDQIRAFNKAKDQLLEIIPTSYLLCVELVFAALDYGLSVKLSTFAKEMLE